MRFTKDSEWKHQTAEVCAKTAETALPKKQSKSARDRGRVHGLTSYKDQTQYLKTVKSSAEAQILLLSV